MEPRFSAWLVWAFAFLSFPGISLGVVLAVGDGNRNTSPPADDPGFYNIGSVGNGSAIYLGNRWVLSAAHVGLGPATFAGRTYDYDPSSDTALTNPPQFGRSETTDLRMFRLADDPNLPALHLGCKSIRLGSNIVLVGVGRDREDQLTHWQVTRAPGPSNDTWEVVNTAEEGNTSGFSTGSNRTLRWGNNVVSRTNMEVNSGRGDVLSFQAMFDVGRSAVEDEAQAVTGDSGGAAFYKNGSVWELAGLIHAVQLDDNQPGGVSTAILGHVTFVADLTRYAEQLNAIGDFAPQPGDFDGDGILTGADIDILRLGILDGSNVCHLDLDADNTVTATDFDAWLATAGSMLGDADVDGQITFDDFLRLSNHFEQFAGWGEGDFDGDGQVSFTDFLVLSNRFGMKTPAESVMSASVPEPETLALLLWASVLAILRRPNPPGRGRCRLNSLS